MRQPQPHRKSCPDWPGESPPKSNPGPAPCPCRTAKDLPPPLPARRWLSPAGPSRSGHRCPMSGQATGPTSRCRSNIAAIPPAERRTAAPRCWSAAATVPRPARHGRGIVPDRASNRPWRRSPARRSPPGRNRSAAQYRPRHRSSAVATAVRRTAPSGRYNRSRCRRRCPRRSPPPGVGFGTAARRTATPAPGRAQ